jgi:hypothetical protein
MRIPLLKITIYSVAGKYQDPINVGTYEIRPLTYELDRIEGDENDLYDYYEEDYLDFGAFKTLFRRILRMIAMCRTPIISKFMSNYSKRLDWDDQMASETIYMDYMRVKSQYMEGSEGVYQGMKEAVHEIVITNAHLIQTAETYQNLHGNSYNAVGDTYTLYKNPFMGARYVTNNHLNVFIPNEDTPDECKVLGGWNTSMNK